MLGRGGVWGARAAGVASGDLPNLKGSPGQIVYVNEYASYMTWQGDRWFPLGVPDPRRGFMVYDEFYCGATSGQIGWTTSGAGATSFLTCSSTTDVGVLTLSVSTGSSIQYIRSSLVHTTFRAGTDYFYEAAVRFANMPTAADDFVFTIGFNDFTAYDPAGACTDGLYFAINKAAAGSSFICVASNASGSTALVSNYQVVANQKNRFGIQVNSSVATFYINGSSVGAISSNVPVDGGTTGMAVAMHKTAGTTARIAEIDYVMLYGYFVNQRTT